MHLRPVAGTALARPAGAADSPGRAPARHHLPSLPHRPLMPSTTPSLPGRRPLRLLAVLVSVCALAAGLLCASQSLAQTRRSKAACAAAVAHAKGKRHTATCTKGKPRRATKRHGKRREHSKRAQHSSRAGQTPTAARCEQGSAPTPTGNGSFSCEGGSEPECEDGATPTPAPGGQGLLCPVSSEGAGREADCEELEEQEGGCGSEAGVQACEAADAGCEGQS